MSFERKQDRRHSPLPLALVITFSLLALPYLVDVVYMEDHTPTHSAQEILSDKDDNAERESFQVFIYDLIKFVEFESVNLRAESALFHPDRFLERTVAPFEYLSIVSLISRPPPSI